MHFTQGASNPLQVEVHAKSQIARECLFVAAWDSVSHFSKKFIHRPSFPIRNCLWMPFPTHFTENGYAFNLWQRNAFE
jgi:hypothetical protein